MKIWCLFVIDNMYDQPDYNLLVWWYQKPKVEMVQLAMSTHARSYMGKVSREKARVVWRGGSTEVRTLSHAGADYRLQQVEEGKLLT